MIVGNWKMNKTPQEAAKLINEIKLNSVDIKQEMILCVPFIDIHTAVTLTQNTNIKIGSQNCHFEGCGAYTGEISAPMLNESSVEYVILGHSERRTYFSETDEIINKKVKAAIAANLKVIFCIGENIREKELNITDEIVSMQIKKGLEGITLNELKQISVAYEPVWAIGTGKTATKEIANNVCSQIRYTISKLYNNVVAKDTRILYGGSVTSKNAKELLSMEHIDGLLVGGASLKADEFLKIVNSAKF